MYELNDLEATIDFWILQLDKFSWSDLLVQKQPGKWSLGQVYIHLLESSNFFLRNVSDCLENDRNKDEPLSDAARKILEKNELPPVEIIGPPSNALTAQPESKENLLRDLLVLKKHAHTYMSKVRVSDKSGKVKHPGLGYLDASQWYQFTDIHLRHHIHQLKRIEKLIS